MSSIQRAMEFRNRGQQSVGTCKKAFGVKHRKWRPITLQLQLSCEGGLMGATPEPVIAKQHPVTKVRFIKMSKGQRWLQKIVTGVVENRTLDATQLLEILLSKSSGGNVIQSDHGENPDQNDPLLDSMAFSDSEDCEPPASKTAAPATSRAAPKMNSIIKITMPEICPAASVRDDGPTREVTTWWHGKRCIWLSENDFEWAISYMRVELDTYGVRPVDEYDDDPASDQCIRWDFKERAWSCATPDGSALTMFRPERITPTDAGVDARAFALLSYSRKKELAYEHAQAYKGGA
jgi:hypothetical protein